MLLSLIVQYFLFCWSSQNQVISSPRVSSNCTVMYFQLSIYSKELAFLVVLWKSISNGSC